MEEEANAFSGHILTPEGDLVVFSGAASNNLHSRSMRIYETQANNAARMTAEDDALNHVDDRWIVDALAKTVIDSTS